MLSETQLTRRQFLKRTATTTGLGLSVTLLSGTKAIAMAGDASANTSLLEPNVFVKIDPQGTVTVTCHRSEMGQQIRTSIAQIIADELYADWDRVEVEQGTGNPEYGDQNTDGSRSIRRNLTRLRQAGAAAAHMLKQAAAKGWNVDVESCDCEMHQVVHRSTGRRVDYADLVSVAAGLPIPEIAVLNLKPREQWQFIGKGITSVDIDKVTSGDTTFGHDVQLDNMLIAMIQRPPVLFSAVKSLDDSKARAIKGVVDVIKLPDAKPPAMFNALGGVAVLATSTWAAMQGLQALDIEWAASANDSYDSDVYKAALINTAKAPGETVRQKGDAKAALAAAENTLSATYYAPHLAQAPMEPPAATADVQEGAATIWACTQTPQSTRQQVAVALGLEPDKVTVNVTLLGGGFGRKSKPDFSVEAAILSKQAKRPVKVVWRREDDIQNGYYHSVSAQHIQAAISEDGKVSAWRHNSVFPSISSTFNAAVDRPSTSELGLGLLDMPFDIPNITMERGQAKPHVRIGWLRSVANVYHAFAVQSFASEIAHETGKDPKDCLLELIGEDRHIDLAAEHAEYTNYGDPLSDYPIDTARLKNVIERVAALSDWDNRHAQGRFLGIAAHRSFLTYVAEVVEVVVDKDGRWHIPHAYVAIDAGTIVNPEHVKAQCEGGMIYGLSCAIGEISAADGRIKQSNFHDYQVARMSHAPKQFSVDIVESTAPPAGVGEPPTPPFAPALANALFAATGQRIRTLPIPLQLTLS